MTLTEQITEQLLDAIEEPGGLDAVYQEFSKSRGPYYQALSNATAQLQEQFEATAQESEALTAHRDFLTEQVSALHDQNKGLEESVQTLVAEVQTAEQRLEEDRGSLDRLAHLAKAGFAEAELGRLGDLLAQVAAKQGGPPEEGVAQFFQTMDRFEQIISFDLEAQRSESRAALAKTEVTRLESELNARLVQSTARISVIDLVQGLLDRGFKAADFADWSSVIERSGVTVDELAGFLEEYSSIEVLSAARQARVEELQTEVTGLEAQVKGLCKERDNVHAAISAVKDRALQEVKSAEKQARKHVDAMFQEAVAYGDLKKEAAELGELINSARDLRSGDLEKWRHLPREVIQHTLTGSIRWAEGDGRNHLVPAPEVVTQTNSLLSYSRLNLRQILLWALSGVLSDGHQGAPKANR